jgi:hypothetical protein
MAFTNEETNLLVTGLDLVLANAADLQVDPDQIMQLRTRVIAQTAETPAQEPDPTRWVREMLVPILETTEAVEVAQDWGQDGDNPNAGAVLFITDDGTHYWVRVSV